MDSTSRLLDSLGILVCLGAARAGKGPELLWLQQDLFLGMKEASPCAHGTNQSSISRLSLSLLRSCQNIMAEEINSLFISSQQDVIYNTTMT